MNIKQKLALRFILVFTVLWIAGSITIYLFSAAFRKEEFYQRLNTRATTAARLLIEVEEVDALLLKKIEAANSLKLPGERITIYDYDNVEVFTTDAEDSIFMDEDRFNQIRLEGEEVSWKQGEIEVLGLLYADQYERFVVVASGQDIYGKRKLDFLRELLIMVGIVSVIIIAIAARIYAGRALKPISHVVDEVNAIGFANISERVSEGNGTDEIAVLGITFNRMLTRLQKAFESQRSFIANASHELRTPMTSIMSQVDVLLLKERSGDEYVSTLKSIKEDVRELSVLAERLLLLARVESFRESFQPVRVDAVLWQAIADVSKTFDNSIIVDFAGEIDDERFLTVKGNEQLLKSVLQNVIENACKYSQGAEVRVQVYLKSREIVFIIKDEGIGIPSEELNKVSEPFFRGGNTGGFVGSGIGLNLCRKIMDIHDATMEIESIPDQGTVVELHFEYITF